MYIIADKYVVEAMPEYKSYVRPNGAIILQVKKAMYGLVESLALGTV